MRLAFLALLVAAPALAQEPAWSLELVDAELPALGAYSHTEPDGDGGLYALAFASAEPYGLDARLDRYDADGALVWTAPVPGEAGRDERPLALAATSAGPCAALAVPDGLARVVEVRCLTPEGGERWTATLDDDAVDVLRAAPENVALAAYDDGGVILVATTPATYDGGRHVLFVRYGPGGAEAWRTPYAPPYALWSAAPVDLAPLPDGGAAAAVTGFRVLRLGGDGAVLWDEDPGPDYWPEPGSPVGLVVAGDGDVVATGNTGFSDAHAPITARFSPGGALRWADYAHGSELAAGTGGTVFEGAAWGGSFGVAARDSGGADLWTGGHAPGGLSDAHLAALVPDSDGGVVLVGSAVRPDTSSTGGAAPRVLVAAAFDSEGAVRWSVQRGGVAGGDALALAAAPLGGNRLGIGGGASSTGTGGPGPALVVLDPAGDEVAAAQTPAAARPFSVIYGAEAVPDGLVLFGQRVGEDGAVGLHVVKVHEAGAVAWASPVPGIARQRYASRYDFRATPDGGALVAGPSGEFGSDIGVARFDADGAVAWTATYDSGGVDDLGSVVPDGSGGAYATMYRRAPEGSPPVELAVVAFGSDGGVRWTDGIPAVGTTGYHDPFADRFGDGVVVSGSALGAGLTRAYAFDGTLLWEHVGGGRPADVHATPDGGACIAALSGGAGVRCIRPDGTLAWEELDLGDNGTGDHPALVAVGADGAVTALVIAAEGPGLRLLRYSADGEHRWTAPLAAGDRPDPTSAYPGSLAVDSDGHAYAAGVFHSSSGWSDAGYFLVDPEGNPRWQHVIRARAPGSWFGAEPRLDLDANEDLYIGALQFSLLSVGPYHEAPAFAFAEVARFDRSSLPVAGEPAAPAVTGARILGPYPNPARGPARFDLHLPEDQHEARVEAFDVLGRRVAVLHDGPLPPGVHRLTLGGARLPAGVYVVRATGGGLDLARRLTLVR